MWTIAGGIVLGVILLCALPFILMAVLWLIPVAIGAGAGLAIAIASDASGTALWLVPLIGAFLGGSVSTAVFSE
jgi:hypothetical protein